MILESYPWKEDLLKMAKLIDRYNTPSHFRWNSEKTYYNLEKTIFTSAFIIRKLIDCKKVSDEVEFYRFDKLLKYKSAKKFDNIHKWIDDKSYEWGKHAKVSLCARYICNSLIHSLIFGFSFQNDKVYSFFIASDKDKDSFLLEIPLNLWVNYMTYVGEDDIEFLEVKCDKNNSLVFKKKRKTLISDI
jgi:hypothetical protein